MGLAKWLGFESGGLPYDVTVEYETGMKGRFPMFAKDGRDALLQLAQLIPLHDRIVRIEFVLRDPQVGKQFINPHA